MDINLIIENVRKTISERPRIRSGSHVNFLNKVKVVYRSTFLMS